MDNAETVSTGLVDTYAKQCEDVSLMRTSLLAFNRNDPLAAKKAIQNITVLRVYHQISRIVRYTELMDKLEDKMYQSINMTLDEMDEADEGTWMKLVALQERLQRSMIDSHKLLEPYLNFEQLAVIDAQPAEDPQASFAAMIQDQASREKLRSSAQAVLSMLEQQYPEVKE